MQRIRLLVSLIVCCVPAVAAADPRIELGIAAGAHAFSKSVELGVDDEASEPGPVSSGAFGLRAALPVGRRLAIEGEGMAIRTKDDVLHDRAMVYGVRAHVRLDLLTGRLRPFVVAGAGMHVLRSTSPQMDDDVDPEVHWGVGVRWALTTAVDVRVDGRQLFVPDRAHNGATSDFEVTAGITYRFGRDPIAVVAPPPLSPPVVVEPPPPVVVAEPPPPPPAPAPIEELAGVSFEWDSAHLADVSLPILDRAVALLGRDPTLSLEIAGHTSAEGDPVRNRSLSLARAEAVKAYLVRKGVAAARLSTVGYGADMPIADNATEDGRKRNRRIEFTVIPAAPR